MAEGDSGLGGTTPLAAAPPPAEAPCFECGSTERMGTACAPCNPEITDPNFGAEAPPLSPLQSEKLVSLIGEALEKAWEHGEACGMGDNPDPFNAAERAQAILAAMGRA